MAGLNFERDLAHQRIAVESVLNVFDDIDILKSSDKTREPFINPSVAIGGYRYADNIFKCQEKNGIDKKHRTKSNIIDISMETGTGKTYTYVKMMFELHRNLKFSKFIVIVPTLSIKAGTMNFLRSESAKEHFRDAYDSEIKTYLVESKKGSKKAKKSIIPQAIREFVEAQNSPKIIHVLVINAGMINSESMSKAVDTTLFDKYNTPFGALASTLPFTIIDEPHKFTQGNKTWENIQKFNSQMIFRYGATFDGKFENLIYQLTAVEAFNNDLVKGVVTYVEQFENSDESIVILRELDGNEATFILIKEGKETRFALAKKESLSIIHSEMSGVIIENMNKSILLLSNGLELRKGDKINPYSYSQSLQDAMIQKALTKHFELEKKYLTREIKIKPLSLFFIDDIEGYREGHNLSGSLKTKFETLLKAHIEKLLQTETHPFYKRYLEKSLCDISLTHGGYFSKDNSESDEKIEKEIEEILHDKEALLSLDNVRRFIFSKWTLREGWDNPNVFQICKLRSSGSVTSKLQEVGRGLRLPVNEYMSRVTDGEKFDLHYYVDFTERDFVAQLVGEINDKSGMSEIVTPTKLNELLIKKIVEMYSTHYQDEEALLDVLDDAKIIKRNNDFKEGGFEQLKLLFPLVFADGLKENKVRSGDKIPRPKATMRTGKYDELKQLWEMINQKVILEYHIENETAFAELLRGYFLENTGNFKPSGMVTYSSKLAFENRVAYIKTMDSIDNTIMPIVTMSYREFLFDLANAISINVNTLHRVLIELKGVIDINLYKNRGTIRIIKGGFGKYLLDNSISKFQIGYNKVSNALHPTKFTDENGAPLGEINAHDLGVHFSGDPVADNYLFDTLFYDSDLEKENISKNIKEVVVFTKIPKNSIKIPVSGGGSYSPDFAYIIENLDGKQTLNLVVETKDKTSRTLYTEEAQKIKHAQELFNTLSSEIKVEFKTQFEHETMTELIRQVLKK
ncbi:MAG: type III restriction-modification system endonuclease [Sulfuricurvum sp.]